MTKSEVSTRKKVGYSLTIAVAAFLIIFVFCGRFFNSALKDVANFFVGSFGMSFYGMMIALICVCSFKLANKTIRIPAKYVTHFILIFVEVVLLVHMFTSLFIYDNSASFAEYAQYVYNYYSKVPTFGGIVFGAITYGLQSVITIYATAFLLFALLAWSVIVIGDFFYCYATGKLSLSQKRKEENNIAAPVVKEVVESVPEVDDERARAYKILFTPDERSLNTEEVSSTEVFGTAHQSTLDSRSTPSREEAENILFHSGSTSALFADRQTDDTSKKTSDNDEIGMNGFFSNIEPDKQQEETSWRISKSTVSPKSETPIVKNVEKNEEKKSSSVKQDLSKGEWITPVETVQQQDIDIVDVVADETVVNSASQKENISTFNTVVDNFDDVANNDSVQDASNDSYVAPIKPIEEDLSKEEIAVDESDDEVVAIEKTKPVVGGVQMGYDFPTKAEVREAEQKVHQYAEYVKPPFDLLEEAEVVEDNDAEYRERAAAAIINKLAVFGIKIELVDQIVGPTVTQYRFKVLSERTKMSDFLRYSSDLKACLEANAEIRIEAPLMGTNLVGIEAPNKVRSKVVLRNLLESKEIKEKKGELIFPLGQEISGKVIVADLARLPHLLVAGTTGSGKSVFLHSMIMSLMFRYGPEYLRFIMVDPKFVELSRYNGIPHMLTTETITTPNDALGAMDYLISEMDARYQLFRQYSVGSIADYNARVNPKLTQRLPYLVLIVDELAELMSACGKQFEGKLQRLAQKARAAGIHMVLATQRPDVKTITGTIKANLPSRVALKVSSPTDSGTILSSGGAEKLLGYGDMLYMDANGAGFTRAQGAYVSNEEIRSFVEFATSQNEVYYDEAISQEIFVSKKQPVEEEITSDRGSDDDEEKLDPYCKKALRFWLERQGGRASIASIQRALKIGFNRAGRIMDSLQRLHYVEDIAASESGSKPVRVLVTLEELDELFPDMED